MNIIKIKIIFAVTISVGFLLGAQFSRAQQSKQIKDYLPSEVNLLKETLDDTFIKNKQNVSETNTKNIKRAKEQAIQWVTKTVRSDKLPIVPNYLQKNIIMIQNAFGPNDVALFKWEKSGYQIKVAQTQTIILIQFQPTWSVSVPQTTKEAKTLMAKDAVTDFLNSEVEIEVVEPTTSKIVKRNIMSDLIGASFDKAEIQDYADGIHSRCGGPKDSSDRDFAFWWRRVNWWTDGKIVTFYTLKTEGGAWEANYTDFGASWF